MLRGGRDRQVVQPGVVADERLPGSRVHDDGNPVSGRLFLGLGGIVEVHPHDRPLAQRLAVVLAELLDVGAEVVLSDVALGEPVGRDLDHGAEAVGLVDVDQLEVAAVLPDRDAARDAFVSLAPHPAQQGGADPGAEHAVILRLLQVRLQQIVDLLRAELGIGDAAALLLHAGLVGQLLVESESRPPVGGPACRDVVDVAVERDRVDGELGNGIEYSLTVFVEQIVQGHECAAVDLLEEVHHPHAVGDVDLFVGRHRQLEPVSVFVRRMQLELHGNAGQIALQLLVPERPHILGVALNARPDAQPVERHLLGLGRFLRRRCECGAGHHDESGEERDQLAQVHGTLLWGAGMPRMLPLQ